MADYMAARVFLGGSGVNSKKRKKKRGKRKGKKKEKRKKKKGELINRHS